MGATVRRNKDRLYVGLYVRRSAGKMAGGEERYHWALLRGPKTEDEDTLYIKYQAVNTDENAAARGSESGSSSSGSSNSNSSNSNSTSLAASPTSPTLPTSPTTWIYDEQSIPPYDMMLLARVLIGKIRNRARFEAVLRNVPVPPANRSSFAWVQAALGALAADAAGSMGKSSNLAWSAVSNAATEYIDHKATEHRYDGRAPVGQFDFSKPATFDLLQGKEIVP
ncbi:hypothetical protein SCUCBS95973_009264 [Sporothrix curviconia]|uniref:Uncharacterized protein n=1 Tax=Sporothrix curviconia TaxID=1260050 RepID=A0ABP0CTE7_9PEZI